MPFMYVFEQETNELIKKGLTCTCSVEMEPAASVTLACNALSCSSGDTEHMLSGFGASEAKHAHLNISPHILITCKY